VAYYSPLFAPGSFSEQVVLVTGGGTGIGLASAREFAALGAKLIIAGRTKEKLDVAERILKDDGGEVLAHTVDIREPDQIDRLVDAALGKFGRIDVLVNNAGGQFPARAEDMVTKGWDAVIRNNLNGTFYMTSSVAKKAMIPQKSGRIVNVTAMVGRGFPGMSHTGAARAAVENLTKSLAVEWASHGIRVNAVAPGNNIRSSGTAQYGEALLDMARKATPLKRLGTPVEVARVIVFLASSFNDFVTGSVYQVDGGQALWGDVWTIDEPPVLPET
jgi:NAD(P)-dependent dehydrogenase (short-subunit alcohol dehydrogenase family)